MVAVYILGNMDPFIWRPEPAPTEQSLFIVHPTQAPPHLVCILGRRNPLSADLHNRRGFPCIRPEHLPVLHLHNLLGKQASRRNDNLPGKPLRRVLLLIPYQYASTDVNQNGATRPRLGKRGR